MKAILLATSLVAVPALAWENPGPYIARQPLGVKPSPQVLEDRMPPVTPALSEPAMKLALRTMTTVEDGIATIGNRQRLLTAAMEAITPLPAALASAVKMLWFSTATFQAQSAPVIVSGVK